MVNACECVNAADAEVFLCRKCTIKKCWPQLGARVASMTPSSSDGSWWFKAVGMLKNPGLTFRVLEFCAYFASHAMLN